MKKIKLTENQLHNILLLHIIKEANFNYHIGDIKDTSNPQPYYSDSKFAMKGRDTGHFGSGMYFSTYQGKYNNIAQDNSNPQLIQIDNNVYRVDFNIYKNLYRVENERQGDMLFNTLRNINNLYYKVEMNNFNCSKNYLIIQRNSEALGLKCPSYKQLMQMAVNLSKDNADKRSFSTLFMEYNGFNGINVSGIAKYDNTLHGSVIYDLSKIDKSDFHKVSVNYNKIPYVDASVASDNELDDSMYYALTDKPNLSAYKLSKLQNDNEILKILKRYPYVLSDFKFISHYFDEQTTKRYLRILYNKIQNDEIKDTESLLNDNDNLELIYNNNAFYYANIEPFRNNTVYSSFLLMLIKLAFWDENNKETITKQILQNTHRELTPFESDVLQKWFKSENINITIS